MSWWRCRELDVGSCDRDQSNPVSPMVSGRNGIVVTDQQYASEVGLQILKEGGNAIDAAVAVGYALAVTNPCCGNLGGGGFMLIRFADGRTQFLDFRETAPFASIRDLYLNAQGEVIPDLSTKGYLAVAVPGTVMGLDRALARYGTMPRQQVMAPAIRLAADGFVLDPGDQLVAEDLETFQEYPNVAEIFLKPGKEKYQEGDRLRQPDLAETLRLIAQQGSDGFYQGAIAETIISSSQQYGGILTSADLASYQVIERQPIKCTYRGYEVISAPPPGGGTTLCQMLNILSGYPLKDFGFQTPRSLHVMLSAMLFAFADRNTHLGDPAFVENPVQRLLSKDYATTVRAQIPEDRALPVEPLYANITALEEKETTHYSIVDGEGNAVAVTYTLNTNYGAGVIAGDTGFFLNNEMDDFSIKPGVPNTFGLVQGKANQIEPGKRPLSSMAPTIVVRNNRVAMVTGSPGGPTIPTTVLQVITNVVDHGMELDKAVNTPRVHYQGKPNFVVTEPYALESATVQRLWEMGYRVLPFKSWGAAETIGVDTRLDWFRGVNDGRRPAGQAIAD